MATHIKMVGVQGSLLQEVADERMTRDDVALTYAFAIRQADEVDFAVVNRAIIDRWSMAGLRYIKQQAWKRVKGQQGESS